MILFPKCFLIKKLKNFKISNFDQKINSFEKFKIDFVIIKKFDKKFSKINYIKFIDNILFKKLKAKIYICK